MIKDRLENALPIKKQIWDVGQIPFATISCTTYNQENFIEECIESFLLQETDFPVEILIHDDASTDSTPVILQNYKEKYAGLITLTQQKDNQFSQGVNVNTFNFERARGQFVALCHGDDYWTDPKKIMKQVALLKQFNVGISGHPADEVNVKGERLGRLTGYIVNQVTHLTIRDLLKRNSNVLPFGSIVIDRKSMLDFIKYMPPVKYHTGLQALGCLRNGLVISPDVMSAYRVDVPGSTTEIMLKNKTRRVATVISRIESFKALRNIYSIDESKYFNEIISSQFAKKSSYRHPVVGIRIMKAIISGESFFLKVKLIILSFKISVVRLLKF